MSQHQRSETPELQREALQLWQQGRSLRQISHDLGVARPVARALLADAGVTVPARGRGRPRPSTRLPRPDGVSEKLQEMYVQQRMNRRQIAEQLGVPEHRVRSWLDQDGIATRTRGAANREDRRRPTPNDLKTLYVERGLTAAQTGQRIGMLLQRVLASLHEQQLPVRIPNQHQNNAMILLDTLYDDDRVRHALDRWAIPIVRNPGQLHERFATPVPLSPQLLRELYVGCGLSSTHIELLTGQPTTNILRQLKKAGVQLRPAGGLSPFLRRVRQLSPDGSLSHQAANASRPPTAASSGSGLATRRQ